MNIASRIITICVTLLKKGWFNFNYFRPVKIGVNYSDGEKCGCGGCENGCGSNCAN